MKQFFGTVLAVFVSLVLFFVAVPVLILPTLVTGTQKPDLPGHMVLELDLRHDFADQPHHNPLNVLGTSTPSIIRVVEAMARAENDERVSGVVARLDGGKGLPLAQAEEIRDAFASFRASGKFIVVHSQSFYSNGLGSYFAASESDELWMQPNGSLATSGVGIGTVFLQRMLDDIGSGSGQSLKALPKAGTVINTNLNDKFKAAYDETAESIYGSAVTKIARSKKMTPDQVTTLLSAGPYLASEALAAGLVSHLGYDDEAENAALKRAGEGAQVVSWDTYLEGAGTPYDEGEVIAVIFAEGPISLGEANPAASAFIGGDTTAKAIRDAANDKMVKAILFRVDSPGGSAVASDQIWDAVNYAKDKGKPVVVSMGSVAAAGGYYIAMSADKIIAQPATITGSIGVVGGKFALGNNFGMLGLVVESDAAQNSVQDARGARAANTDQWQSVNKVLGNIYTDFTSKVAEGRSMSVSDVHQIAQGRLWSGAQAKQIGLIDDLGGFRFAIGETKKMIGLDANAAVELRSFPGPKGKREQFMEMLGVSTNILKMFYSISQLGQVETLKDLAGSIYNDAQPSDLAPEHDKAE